MSRWCSHSTRQQVLALCSQLARQINGHVLAQRSLVSVLMENSGLYTKRFSLIYSSTFCETKKTTDYTDSTDRSRTVPEIRAIRVIRGLNSGVHGVVTTVDGLVNPSG